MSIRSIFLSSLAVLLCSSVPVFAQGCGPSNPNCIVPTPPLGTCDARAASTLYACSVHPTYLYNAVDAGLDNSGITDNSARLTALVAEAATEANAIGGSGIYFPCGQYLINATINVTTSNLAFIGESRSCVQFLRTADYGPMWNFANSTGSVNSITMSGFQIYDQPASTGAAGYSTCANSPYQIVWDGVYYSRISDVRFALGCGGLAIRGGYSTVVLDIQMQFAPITGAPGQNNLGTALFIGYTANTHITASRASSGCPI